MANANDIDASAFTENGHRIIFSRFATAIRNHVGEEGESEIEALVSSILKRNDTLDTVRFDAPLGGEQAETTIFEALVSNKSIKQLCFLAECEASCIPAILRRAMPLLQNTPGLPSFAFSMTGITATEAHEIFGILQGCSYPHGLLALELDLTDHHYAVLTAIARCIRESTTMLKVCFTVGGEESTRVQEEPFRILCEAVSKSSSLYSLTLVNAVVREEYIEGAVEHLANCIANSATLKWLSFDTAASGTFTMDRVCQALSRTDAAKNFDLFFRKKERAANGYEELQIVRRTCPFKLALSQNIPLNQWSSILSTAGTCTLVDSHGPLDFVFLLAKEKNDVLFRDAAMRRTMKKLSGRKRKRGRLTITDT